ncbi:plectin-like [Quercus lobata]|uniref:plectin-like n=1 Tax=Quercus lobata TaxID=97700 RepID=UPI0012481E00|nr:plectin-like [Quercus lobata]
MRNLGDGEGGYVADALGRTMLLPTDMAKLKNMRMQEVFLSAKRYLGMAIQANYRMEEEVKGQSKTAKFERDKRIDAARTLKNSEADLAKAKEDLKEAVRDRDCAVAGLTGAQKQAEEQTKRLLAAEEQLQIAKEQISDLKKKLVMADNAKGVAEFTRDEAMRAKQEAEFARTEAETAKDKAEEEGYEAGVADTQASLKAQIPGVCRLYCSQVWEEALKRVKVEASSDLWKAESVFYPPAIRETTSTSSEAMSAPQEAEAAESEAAQIIVTPGESTEGGEPHAATEAPGGLNPEMPKEAAEPTVSTQISSAEELAIFVQPLQAIPLTDVPQSTETNPAQPSQEGDVSQGPEAIPARPSQDVAKMKSKK